MRSRWIGSMLVAAIAIGSLHAQEIVDRWVVATGRSAGDDDRARSDATAQAMRKAVEEACGVFLTGESKNRNYRAVYDRVLTNTAGYVREHTVVKTQVVGGVTIVEIRARVSTQKFEQDWAAIAHTIDQENNPRLIVAIAESVHQRGWGNESYETNENGIVQSQIEEYLISKGLTLMDRTVAGDVSKRDVLLAAVKDEPSEAASMGARFNADVVVTGMASVKYGNAVEVAGQTMHQYIASLSIRVIQTDSARILASISFDPVTVTTMQRTGGEDKAFTKLAEQHAPALLAAVVEAWRKRENVSRTVNLSIAGMDYQTWKLFREDVSAVSGIQNARLREITEGLAQVDIESEYNNESLADRLSQLPRVKLTVTEITANRLKLRLNQ